MILETGQMLSTLLDGPYKPLVKLSHPSYNWLQKTKANRTWLYNLFEAMSHEYFYRFNRTHKTWTVISDEITGEYATERKTLLDNGNIFINDSWFTRESAPFFPPPQVLPRRYRTPRGRAIALGRDLGQYQSLATIMAYRRFYIHDKAPHCKWTKREAPTWFTTKNLWDIMKEMIRIEGLSPPDNREKISENGEPFYTIFGRGWHLSPPREPREDLILNTINPIDATTTWRTQFERAQQREIRGIPEQLVIFDDLELDDDIPF